MDKKLKAKTKYETIIVGAGAGGLYCAAALSDALVLEKTKRPGTKLLMAGNGQCNVTHGGSIKEFLKYYGDKGKKIRSVLQKHSNVELCRYLESLGIPLLEREDGKIFPKSMDAHDVLEGLLTKTAQILFEEEVTAILKDEEFFEVLTDKGRYNCTNLVIATGGCSYPTTGSDGKMLKILERDFGIEIVPPKPALTPVFVENYRFEELSGISFKDAGIIIYDGESRVHQDTGDLLLTFKNFSGPVIINNSRYIKTGMTIELNFPGNISYQDLLAQLKNNCPGNNKSVAGYISEDLSLPKRFAKLIADNLGIGEKKLSQLGGAEMKELAKALTAQKFIVSGLAGFKEAMVTAGGVALDEVDLKTMESKRYPGLFFIGEVLDVDGDTGGYNLQFAYSSAMAAADKINSL